MVVSDLWPIWSDGPQHEIGQIDLPGAEIRFKLRFAVEGQGAPASSAKVAVW